MEITMKKWNIEITDTFGGEANYCWVRRYVVEATTERGAINKIAREYGSGWRKSYDGRYDMKNDCVCLFIDEVE